MKTILIAGGCGFIGSNLCAYFIQNNNKVICLDNFYTGNINNVNAIMNDENFTLIEHDIIEPIFIEQDIDEIYHLACPASPPKYQEDPIYTCKINFIGTMNLLGLAKEKNAKILLSSTSEVYGEPKISPQPEIYRGNVNTIGIRSCYDEGKRVAETLMMDYHKVHNIDTKIARIFNTYGPFMDKDDGRVVTNFVKQMLTNQDITIYGDGSQTRSFCYIDDQINGLVKLMQSDCHDPINIGNPNEISIRELIRILQTKIDTSSQITYRSLPEDDPTNRRPDITKAKKLLKWYPEVELEEGIKKTIEYLRTTCL
jgi:nucleoside-diphosphate-sugar epimerase